MAITKTISAKALVSGTNVLKIWTTGTNAGTIKKIRVIKSKEAGDIAKGVNLPGTVGAVAIPAGMSNALAEKFTKAWSQEGADVTSENTSADTAKVNGQDASVVQQNAANAKAAVDAQAEDGQISPAEKADWRINKPIMERNYNEAATYAFQLGVNHSDLDTKWAALVTYLEGAGVWSSPYSTYIISNNELVAKNDDYYAALLAVEQACIDQAADDAKNSAISTAATDATNKANTAQSDAEATARSEITGRGLDATGNFIGTVSGVSAATVKNQAADGSAAKSKLDTDVGAGTVETTGGSQSKVNSRLSGTEKNNLVVGKLPNGNNNSADNISESTVRKWAGESGADKTAGKSLSVLTDKKTSVLTDDDALGETALWVGVSGTGRPEDNATKGARAGDDLKDFAGVVLGDSDIKNAEVSITSSGQLQGAGGGQVTPDGIGAETPTTVQPKINQAQINAETNAAAYTEGWSEQGATNDSGWRASADTTRIDAGKVWAGSSLTIGNLDGVSDFFRATPTEVGLWRYLAGQHRLYTSLVQHIVGEAESGVLTEINGPGGTPIYFKDQPKIILSLKDAPLYKADYAGQDQHIRMYPTDIEEFATNRWRFKPICELVLTDGVLGEALSYAVSGSQTGDGQTNMSLYTPDHLVSNENCRRVVVSGTMKAAKYRSYSIGTDEEGTWIHYYWSTWALSDAVRIKVRLHYEYGGLWYQTAWTSAVNSQNQLRTYTVDSGTIGQEITKFKVEAYYDNYTTENNNGDPYNDRYYVDGELSATSFSSDLVAATITLDTGIITYTATE